MKMIRTCSPFFYLYHRSVMPCVGMGHPWREVTSQKIIRGHFCQCPQTGGMLKHYGIKWMVPSHKWSLWHPEYWKKVAQFCSWWGAALKSALYWEVLPEACFAAAIPWTFPPSSEPPQPLTIKWLDIRYSLGHTAFWRAFLCLEWCCVFLLPVLTSMLFMSILEDWQSLACAMRKRWPQGRNRTKEEKL